jgi:ubiquitin-activating enzyme E1 C
LTRYYSSPIVYPLAVLPFPLTSWDELTFTSQITRPSLAYSSGTPLFFQAPPQLYDATKGNLEKLVGDLVNDGDGLVVTDPGLPFRLDVVVKLV